MPKFNQTHVESVKVATGESNETKIKELLMKHNGSVLLTIRDLFDGASKPTPLKCGQRDKGRSDLSESIIE